MRLLEVRFGEGSSSHLQQGISDSKSLVIIHMSSSLFGDTMVPIIE